MQKFKWLHLPILCLRWQGCVIWNPSWWQHTCHAIYFWSNWENSLVFDTTTTQSRFTQGSRFGMDEHKPALRWQLLHKCATLCRTVQAQNSSLLGVTEKNFRKSWCRKSSQLDSQHSCAVVICLQSSSPTRRMFTYLPLFIVHHVQQLQ